MNEIERFWLWPTSRPARLRQRCYCAGTAADMSDGWRPAQFWKRTAPANDLQLVLGHAADGQPARGASVGLS